MAHKRPAIIWWSLLIVCSLGFSQRPVYFLEFSGVIGPVSVNYITSGIEKAEKENALGVILTLNTPGGLDESMREICKKLLNTQIPVVTYIAPAGARAASAGVFIAYASHLIAMARGTNIGAAHPVSIGGKEISKELEEKITNDAVSFLVAISEKRGRNKVWAEEAVRKSASVSAEQALQRGICDLLADSEEELLKKIDALAEKRGFPKGFSAAPQKRVGLNFRDRFLLILTNPNIAYILLMLGIYGLFFELQAPGSIFPGTIGAICLLLGLYALSILPTNYTGLFLIGVAVVFFILEIYVTSYGFLTIGGILALVIGSLLLFSGSVPYFRIAMPVLIAVLIVSSLLFIIIIYFGIRAHRRKVTTGVEGLVGSLGRAVTDLSPTGTVAIHGELWNARSQEGTINKGETVKVTRVEGLWLYVKRGSNGTTP
jgi:membrane-bound serine protease (ClpP class)